MSSEVTLRKAAARWHAAKARERAAMLELEAAIVEARGDGMSQRGIVDVAGIARHTVLRALGTPPPSRAPRGGDGS